MHVLPLLFWLCGMRLYLLLFRSYRKCTLCKCLVKMIFCLQVNVVILSYLTNILVDSLGEDSNEGDLNQIFLELFTHNDGLFSFCQSFPTVRVFLSPPNVRLKPTWFSRLRPSIIRVLHRFLYLVLSSTFTWACSLYVYTIISVLGSWCGRTSRKMPLTSTDVIHKCHWRYLSCILLGPSLGILIE